MTKIKHLYAREILDSRGNPTVETTVVLNDNTAATASCPSGASIGTYEATELRDHDATHFAGLGVLKAVGNVAESIGPKIVGMEVTKQHEIDKTLIELDGTQNKSRLGANAILSVSMAVAKAAAKASNMTLHTYIHQFLRNSALPQKMPTPLFNLINGGKHADNNIDFQEFFVIPASSKTYQQAIEMGVEVRHALKNILEENNQRTLVADEGGFGPKLDTNVQGLQFLKQAIENANVQYAYDAFLGIDAAANSFYKEKSYRIKDKSSAYSPQEMVSYYEEIDTQFRLLYLEDPFAEDDWDSWKALMQKMTQDTMIVGDDLTTTNAYRLQIALDKKAMNAIIIKPNQIGTVIEALAVSEVAKETGIKIIVSHRSGETNDDFIADFAIGAGADYVKFGAPVRGERVAKYNRLSQIANELASQQ